MHVQAPAVADRPQRRSRFDGKTVIITGGAGGMEYPTLVTTGSDTVLARPGIRAAEYVTIHEVGHNWFQGILAFTLPEALWLAGQGVSDDIVVAYPTVDTAARKRISRALARMRDVLPAEEMS